MWINDAEPLNDILVGNVKARGLGNSGTWHKQKGPQSWPSRLF
jgi:hypothetical protein